MCSRLFCTLVCLILLGCTSQAAPSPTPGKTATADNPHALIQFQGDYFVASGNCAFCHTGLKNEQGKDVSIDTDWRSTMMANAARDPYYRATVRSEVSAFPDHQTAIETKCATCHTAMAFTSASADQSSQMLLDDGFFSQKNEYHLLAEDGVSCTVCHQIQDHQLGDFATFSGKYHIDTETSHGNRISFGPNGTTDALATMMQNVSGYIPKSSEHMAGSAFCGVCHTLFTNTFTAEGEITDHLFPEQTPYLEWLHSGHSDETSCQDCHMPSSQSSARIANMGGEPRTPFNQHIFVGGNVFMMQLFQKNAEALRVTASNEQFAATEQATREQLEQKTVHLSVEAKEESTELVVTVSLTNLTGHKFPSGFPSRRAWINLIVLDSNQKPVFESGGWNDQGAIHDNLNDFNGQAYESHYDEINKPEQVQIYETIIGCMDGELTTSLMRAHHYIKDNRLLPAGFEKSTADETVQVAGKALTDSNFAGGTDTVTYRIDTGQSSGPYTIYVNLLYQPAGYRWLHKFSGDDSAEAITFLSYLENTPPQPAVVAHKELTYQPE